MSRPIQRNISILFATRIIRLFCYGFLSVILALYLADAGLTESQIGLLFTLTLVGDAGISLWLTTFADHFGRKCTLLVGALLMAGAGIVFLLTDNLIVLMAAGSTPIMDWNIFNGFRTLSANIAIEMPEAVRDSQAVASDRPARLPQVR